MVRKKWILSPIAIVISLPAYVLLLKQMAERDGVTEALKAQDQMAWVGRMNNIRNRATAIVNDELIYS